MAAVRPLDVDPKNLAFEFKKDWLHFRQSRVQKFLALYLQKELHQHRLALESVKPEDVRHLQGKIQETREILRLVESDDCTSYLRQAVEFIEKDYAK